MSDGLTLIKSSTQNQILTFLFHSSFQSRRRSDDMDIDSDDDYENGGRGGLGSSRGGGNWEEVSKKKDESGSGHTGYLYDRYTNINLPEDRLFCYENVKRRQLVTILALQQNCLWVKSCSCGCVGKRKEEIWWKFQRA